MRNTELVEFVTEAMYDAWGYVWGADGELYTSDLADKWAKAKRGGKDATYFLSTCKRWIGHYVSDCSGLIIAALRSENPNYKDQYSGELLDRCTKKGNISSLPEVPGLLLYKPGHVGIYIGSGYAIEARGVAYGVVRTKLSGRGWTKWGYLADVDYGGINHGANTDNGVGTGSVNSMVVTRLLKKTSPMLVGDDVDWLQQQLLAAGFDPGKVDGCFGSNTDKAVRAFQKAKGLTVDGIAGRNTIAALGGQYRP